MRKFAAVCSLLVCAACGRPEREAELNKPASQTEDVRCNAVLDGEVQILRAGSELLCMNGGDTAIDLEISAGNGGKVALTYNLSPHQSRKLVLPFASGLVLADIYLRINEGKWHKLCRHE